jgi:hypothetical protein
MGLNPTILRQVRAFALTVTPSAPPAVHRRGYRTRGLVLTSAGDIQSLTTNVRRGGPASRDNHSTNVCYSRSIIQSRRSAFVKSFGAPVGVRKSPRNEPAGPRGWSMGISVYGLCCAWRAVRREASDVMRTRRIVARLNGSLGAESGWVMPCWRRRCRLARAIAARSACAARRSEAKLYRVTERCSRSARSRAAARGADTIARRSR